MIPIYCIVIKDNPISEMYFNSIKESWKGYKLKKFNAVTPKDLVYESNLKFGKKTYGRVKREFTVTEKAVWYSHFKLWCQCALRNEPMIIIEHDSYLQKPLPKEKELKKSLYRYLSYKEESDGTTNILSGSGMYITKRSAEKLVTYAVAKPIDRNSDGHINSVLKPDLNIDYKFITQELIDNINTIDHKTDKRKYIGLDYEDFDISSLHG
tara:strand:- start:926 stop:1555 length:630 start_codon:yes stop_codon:yes gene_type:complete